MAEGYVDNPYNIQEIMPWIITGKDQIISEIFFPERNVVFMMLVHSGDIPS